MPADTSLPSSNRIAQWFGSDCSIAKSIGAESRGCRWAGVPFVGGCSALQYIKAGSGIAGDLHRHLVNLARVIREPDLKDQLVARLDATLFHPDELAAAQRRCKSLEVGFTSATSLFSDAPEATSSLEPNVPWAADYFVCSWMGRGGRSGQRGEFDQSLSFRWNANGGDSCKRFRSTTESLDAWSAILRPWNVVVLDAFEFLQTAKDAPENFYYIDAPWPDDGDVYSHAFTEQHQRDLAKLVTEKFVRSRVVVRYGDHPLIRELYSAGRWNWLLQESRAQTNGKVNEALIINGPSYALPGKVAS